MKIYLMGLLSFFLTSFSAYANCCFVFPHNYNGQTNTNNPPTAGDYNRQNLIFIPGDKGNYNSSSSSVPNSVLRQLEENEREFRKEFNGTLEKYNALAEKTKKEFEEELKIKIAPEPMPYKDYKLLGEEAERERLEKAEKVNKEFARQEAELEERVRKSNAEAAEFSRARNSYFKLESKEKVIEKTRHNLSSSSFAEYREAVGKLADLFDKYHELKAQGKNEHLAEIKSVLDQFVDDNGIINEFKPFFKQIENVQFKTNINQLESSLKFSYYTKIIKNINNSLGVLKNSYSPISLEKAEIAIENSLKADALLAENRLDTANRYSNRASTSINFINNVSTNIYARASRNTLSKDYFNISAVNGNTYENYSIIDASNRLARKLKTHYSDEAVFYGNLKLREAEYQAANGEYRKFESNLDSVWQLYDALSSIGKGVATGTYNVAADTVESTIQVLLNPLGTIEGIASAIYNYDHTYNYIYNSVRDTINNFENLTLEERSRLFTEVGLSIATIITPRSVIKSSAQAAKIAQASQIATARTMERFANIIPEGGYTPLVNGQYGLFKYEGNGGHTISRHVSLEQSLLKERAMRQGIPSVSSFTNLNVAERAVADVLKQNKTRIDEWLSTPPKPGERPFNLNSTEPSATSTGILYDLHSNTFLEVNNTRVAIVRDSAFNEGYRVLTGFPQR